MTLHLYLEIITAVISLAILIMVVYLIWFMIKKQNVVRSIMFLKGDKFKNPTIIISFGIILFVLRESYKATGLLGIDTSELLVELLESGTVLMVFLGVLMVFRLFWRKKSWDTPQEK